MAIKFLLARTAHSTTHLAGSRIDRAAVRIGAETPDPTQARLRIPAFILSLDIDSHSMFSVYVDKISAQPSQIGTEKHRRNPRTVFCWHRIRG
jgi:hypothetical protein